MTADLGNAGIVRPQVGDQITQSLVLLRRIVVRESVSGRRSMPAKQADADRAGVVALRVRADILQRPASYNLAVPVDQEVIPDVGPPAILDVPPLDLGHLLRRRAG